MSSLRRKLRQKKDQNSKRIKEGLRADPFDDFDEESIRPKKDEDEDEDSSTNGSDSDDGVGDDDGYGVTVGEVGDSAGDDADPEAHRGANDADREGNGTSDRETKQNDQQDWYSKGIMEEPGGSSGGGDEGRGGPGASIQPASQAKPFFRVRRRTYRSRTIIGRARGWIKDRTDDFKEWANGMILDNQYGAICMRAPSCFRLWCDCFSHPFLTTNRPALPAREESGLLPGSLQGQSRSDDYS